MKRLMRYVAFNPSSSDADEYWTESTLSKLQWHLRSIAEVSGTLCKTTINGRYLFADLEVYDLRKHPKLQNEMIANCPDISIDI